MKSPKEYAFSSGKKQKALNAIAALLSFAVGFGVSFFLSPFLLQTLGKEAYSYYPLSTNIVNAMTVVSAAMNSMASRFITVSLVSGDTENAEKYYSSTLFVDFIYSAILIVFTAFFLVFIQSFIQIPNYLLTSVRLLFLFTIASAIVNILSTVFGVATFATNRIELRSIREIVTSLLRGGLFLLLYFLLPSNLYYIGIVALAVAVVSLIIQWIYTKRLLPLSFSRKNISKTHAKEIFISSFWVSVNSLGNLLFAGSTLLIINWFYGPTEGSTASIAMTLSTLLSGVITTLIGVYYPSITKNVADDDREGLKRSIQKCQIACGVLGCAVISVILPFSKSFFQLWVPGEDASLLSRLTIFTMLPYIPTSLFWVATYVNTATNDVKLPAIAMTISGIVNVGIQVLLGALGLDWFWIVVASSIVQFLFMATFLPLYMAKTTSINWRAFYINPVKIILLSVISYVLAYSVQSMFEVNSWIKFFLIGGGTGIVSLGMYAIGMMLMQRSWFIHLWRLKR